VLVRGQHPESGRGVILVEGAMVTTAPCEELGIAKALKHNLGTQVNRRKSFENGPNLLLRIKGGGTTLLPSKTANLWLFSKSVPTFF